MPSYCHCVTLSLKFLARSSGVFPVSRHEYGCFFPSSFFFICPCASLQESWCKDRQKKEVHETSPCTSVVICHFPVAILSFSCRRRPRPPVRRPTAVSAPAARRPVAPTCRHDFSCRGYGGRCCSPSPRGSRCFSCASLVQTARHCPSSRKCRGMRRR